MWKAFCSLLSPEKNERRWRQNRLPLQLGGKSRLEKTSFLRFRNQIQKLWKDYQSCHLRLCQCWPTQHRSNVSSN